MAVPNTFTNGTVADATKVNENFIWVNFSADRALALTLQNNLYLKMGGLV